MIDASSPRSTRATCTGLPFDHDPTIMSISSSDPLELVCPICGDRHEVQK